MRLRVFDVTQATVITPDVGMIDTAREPFNVVARNLKSIADRGIWLSPFRGVPPVNGIPVLDVVYLDASHRVTGLDKEYQANAVAFDADSINGDKADSALVLPTGSAEASRIQAGDQLRFSDAVTGLLWASDIVGIANAEQQDAEGGTAQGQISPKSESEAAGQVQRDYSPEPEPKPGALRRALGWLVGVKPLRRGSDRRKGTRRAIPGLVAYFWTGGAPKAYEVANISTEGFYLLTEERWMPGTAILVTLQIGSVTKGEPDTRISVQCKVVWAGSDGVGFEYDTSGTGNLKSGFHVSDVEELVQLQRFLQRLKG